MRESPASAEIRALDDWQIDCLYEAAMNFDEESMRRAYFERKRHEIDIDDEAAAAMRAMGWDDKAIKKAGG